MTKVTVQTPSEKIITKSAAQLKSEVVDSQGRVFKLRMPDALDELDFYAALGSESTNMGVIAMTMPLLYIESIDNETFPRLISYAQIRGSVQSVGREAIKLIMQAIQEYTEAQGLNEQEQMKAIKK